MLLQYFQYHIRHSQLITLKERVLIAVSGGADSVVLSHLMKESGFDIGIAHCNFKLRGAASDGDAVFVKALAKKLGVPFFETSFETEKLAYEQKTSIQIIARNLRYDWLKKIRQEHKFDCIATAHHLNDSIETMIYNLTKGCGIHGLHGVNPRFNDIVRPLLFANKEQVLHYSQTNNIAYREDASNRKDKYARNHIRLNVVPLLKKINPSLEQTFQGNIQRLRETEELYNWSVEYWTKELVEKDNDILKINTHNFDKVPALLTVLYEILQEFGFHVNQIQKMLAARQKDSGKRFYANDNELLIDRKYWLIRKSQKTSEELIITNEVSSFKINEQETLSFQVISTKNLKYEHNHSITYFDKQRLKFPLKLRRWQLGDTFQPFGMKGKHKKLSDYFHNKKLSLFEKEKIWILESQGKIVWIVGYRSDERFKVTKETAEVLMVTFS